MATYKLRKKSTILVPSKPTSDGRYVEKKPQKVCDVWAEIMPLSSVERVAANQVYAGATHRAVIRWPEKNIEPKMHLEPKDTKASYPILGVVDIEGQGRYLELTLSAPQQPLGTDTMR